MKSTIEIALLVLLPLAWGLGVEFIFERLRRRKARTALRAQQARPMEGPTPHDWVI